MSTLTKVEVAQRINGKNKIILDEMMYHLGLTISSENKNEVCKILRDLNWEPSGFKRFLGKDCVTWTRRDDSKDLELTVRKLELLNERQDRDINTIKFLTGLGFTKQECLDYLRMIYNANLEVITVEEDEEEEARKYADIIRAELSLSKKYRISGEILEALAYMYYIDENFPRFSEEAYYKRKRNFVFSMLDIEDKEDKKLVEWKVFTFEPGLLDLLSKIDNHNHFKKYVLKYLLRLDTREKFNLFDFNSRTLNAICILLRKLNRGQNIIQLVGITKKTQEKILDYGKEINN